MARGFEDRGLLGPNVFLLDCGATTHMVDDSISLVDERGVNTEIRGVGEGRAVAVGTLCAGGIEFTGTLKVPGLGVNLISEGVLHGFGCDIVSSAKEGWRRVFYEGEILIEAKFEKGLFVWRPRVDEHWRGTGGAGVRLLAGRAGKGGQQLWHQRLGHLNYGDMDRLRGMSTGMTYVKGEQLGMCVACCRAKMDVRPFLGHNEKGGRALQVVYADLWGPVTTSLQGHKCALLLVDDYTAYTWVYFLAVKSQAEDSIRQFVVQQATAGKYIEKIRTDNGGEFLSSSLAEFFAERGIS